MSCLMQLTCLGCGKMVPAQAWDAAGARCGACGNPLCAVGRLESADRGKGPKAASRPGRPSPNPGPTSSKPTGGRTERTWKWGLAVLSVLLGLLLIGGEVCVLEAGRQRHAEQWANESVAGKIEDARALASRQRWNEAAALLRDALATEGATDFGEAGQLLAQAGRFQAAALWEAAQRAIQDKKTAQALSLLQAYLAEPEATDKERADQLRSALVLATSATKAAELLRRQPDELLTAFAAGGGLPALDQIEDGRVRAVYTETLRAQVAREVERRTDSRRIQEEELAKRDARIRGTPAFRELLSFLDTTRKRRAGGDPQLMAYLLKELNVTDPGEQSKVLAELTGQRAAANTLEKTVAAQRAVLKGLFRSYGDFAQADQEAFDRIVDQELDNLLREGQG